jgi:hypothetical protein
MLLVAPPLVAQRGRDIQAFALGLVRDSPVVGAGAGAGLRFGRGLRVGGTVAAGWTEPDVWVGRGELVLAFHLYPVRPGRAGGYVGAGVGGELARRRLRGVVLALLGVEARPWRHGGLFAEVGVGGGVRLALGYRTIRLAGRR